MPRALYYALPLLGGYSLTSWYLLRNPHYLHQKKQLSFHCRHLSHRGGAGEKIENTMEAFTNAVAQHTDLLELDCHLTKDGRVVVSHDLNLLRQTGHNVNICDLNYSELPQYKKHLEVTFHSGNFSSGHDRRIPLLEEVFQKFPNMPVSIEIKEDKDELIKKVSDLVKQYQRSDRTIWASVSNAIMNKCRKENPDMPFSFTRCRGVLLLLLFYTGLLPFVPLKESVASTVMPSIINRAYYPQSSIMRNWILVRLMEKLIMRKSLIRHLKDRGIQVYFWVLNQELDFQTACKLKATGIITDYPSHLCTFLKSTGH
ncbi:lysophospholipase D GDPD3 [Microcaecilia unicolor]|uniref:Lysophospholipase D GDPD3 n=1 Tax=Microcaecilia unicolor TaxID=1415580 RepID=A0A6P7YLP8_9AMPH|nr:lysophospholipase D GDPD3 [Microcaecilia unicolor]